ncbi:MAG: class I SAM-dependent methyltransferase [Actinobacteria bacterium]|nr:class I SAM-dependent methyltransferase [Actinomycetota bacterium]
MTPDNEASWDALAGAYQEHVGWPDDELTWGWRTPPESELRLVSDVVAGATTLVLGCGGGQDLVALARLGAGALTGLDVSSEQLSHARSRLAEAGVAATLVHADAADLDRFDAGTFDLVVSVQALDYVADVDALVAGVTRILRPGGVLAFSVMHPAEAATDDTRPWPWTGSYFEAERDWVWDGLADDDLAFRSWFRSPAAWFTALTDGGLVVDRLLEPAPVDDRRWIERGWLDEDGYAKLDRVPATILVRAHRPRPDPGSGPTTAAS